MCKILIHYHQKWIFKMHLNFKPVFLHNMKNAVEPFWHLTDEICLLYHVSVLVNVNTHFNTHLNSIMYNLQAYKMCLEANYQGSLSQGTSFSFF